MMKTWTCEECEYTQEVSQRWIADHGTPVCPNCDIDMILADEELPSYAIAVKQGLVGLGFVSTGLCAGCETCRDEYRPPVQCECGAPDAEGPYCDPCDDSGMRRPTEEEFSDQLDRGEAFCEPFFSWLGCDICGSSLGGSFEPWHGVDARGEIVHGDRACVDCVQYLVNGTLPGSDE